MAGLSLGRVGNLLGIAVLGIALLLAILLVAPGLVGAESSLVVKSDSMSPSLGAGDVVVVSATDATSLSTGMIVTYRATGPEQSVVTHRIVEVRETSEGVRYVTKGDANEEPDAELIAPSQIVGTVWFSIPALGHLVIFANTNVGLATLVIVPAILLIGSELYSLYVEATPEQSPQDGERQ